MDTVFASCLLDQKTKTLEAPRRWEFSSLSKQKITNAHAIGWHRVGAIFGHPKPPHKVTERQFDDFDDELRKLAQTPYEKIDFGDLWYYHHDLAYVELQASLFQYLFPVCLMDWHLTLMDNQSCSHGDSEFHYGILRGDVLNKMLTDQQRSEVDLFFRDSFIHRLDAERGLRMVGSGATAHGWMFRLNSLGIVTDLISEVWDLWWALSTVGRAVSAIQYLSGLMYFDGENPVFDMWTSEKGGGGPYLWENDSHIYSTGWRDENVEFLRKSLNYDFAKSHLPKAVDRLKGLPEHTIGEKVLADLPERQEIVESRSSELPTLLSKHGVSGWSV